MWLGMGVFAGCQEPDDLFNGRGNTYRGWPDRSQRGDITERLDQGFFVEEDQGVEGLVLGGGADVLTGELGEEGFELFLAGKAFRVTISQVANET